MAEILGLLLTIAIVLVGVIVIVAIIVALYSKLPLERKYEGPGGGLGGSFEAVWMPSAHEAGMERDRQTTRTAPAPTPGDPPDGIRDDRITLDL